MAKKKSGSKAATKPKAAKKKLTKEDSVLRLQAIARGRAARKSVKQGKAAAAATKSKRTSKTGVSKKKKKKGKAQEERSAADKLAARKAARAARVDAKKKKPKKCKSYVPIGHGFTVAGAESSEEEAGESDGYISSDEGPKAVPIVTDPAERKRLGDALCAACQVGDYCGCEDLLEEGADPNYRDRKGSTPLMHAAWHGWVPLLESCLEYGAKVDLYNARKNTALHFAYERGHEESILVLVEGLGGQEALRLKNDLGCTPKRLAAMGAAALVSSHAEVFAGKTIAQVHTLRFKKIMERRLSQMSVSQDPAAQAAIAAARAKVAETEKTTENQSADGSAPTATPTAGSAETTTSASPKPMLRNASSFLNELMGGESDMQAAKDHGLIEGGRPDGDRDVDHVFEEACVIGADMPVILELLDKRGAKMNYTHPGSGSTPLMHAVWWGRTAIVKLLVEGHAGQKADVNAVSTYGSTALHFAYEHNREHLIVYLLNNGAKASLDKKNQAGLTPSECSTVEYLKHMHLDHEDMHEEHATLDMLHAACRTGDLDKVGALMDCGLDEEVNETCKDGRSALVHAILADQCAVAKMLIIDYCASACIVMTHDDEADEMASKEAAQVAEMSSKGTEGGCVGGERHAVVDGKAVVPGSPGGKSRVVRREDEGRTALHIAYAECSFFVIKALLMYCEDADECMEIRDAKGKLPHECCPFKVVQDADPAMASQIKACKAAFIQRLKSKGRSIIEFASACAPRDDVVPLDQGINDDSKVCIVQ